MTRAARRWVAERTPSAPAALAALVDEALRGEPDDRDDVARACLHAGERALAGVLSLGAEERCAARGVAHELLTADALVTYAFEASAERPEHLAALAREAMATLSRVGADGPPAP